MIWNHRPILESANNTNGVSVAMLLDRQRDIPLVFYIISSTIGQWFLIILGSPNNMHFLFLSLAKSKWVVYRMNFIWPCILKEQEAIIACQLENNGLRLPTNVLLNCKKDRAAGSIDPQMTTWRLHWPMDNNGLFQLSFPLPRGELHKAKSLYRFAMSLKMRLVENTELFADISFSRL